MLKQQLKNTKKKLYSIVRHPIIAADSESLWENFTHYVHPRANRRPTLYMILYILYLCVAMFQTR